LSVFGGSAWEWDAATGQYYLHSFLKQQPDLNWRNPAVKAAIFDAVRFWLARGVDGFRIDVAHYIMKDPQLRDNPPNSGHGRIIHKPIGEYDTQLHVYDNGHPDVHAVYRELRRLLDSYDGERPRMCVGEIHLFNWQEWASYYGRNLDELHMPFNFGLLKVEWQARAVRQLVDTVEAVLPAGAWPNYVLSNHDEPRVTSRYGLAQARLAAMLRLTLRGTPTLYYGDELGMTDVPIPPDREQDPWGKREPGLGVGRDPERTPMQWDDSPNAGFTPAHVDPWLPVSPDYRTVNVQAERDDPSSMLNLHRQLLARRRQSPALHSGSYQPVEQVPDDCFVYVRRRADECMLVALNFSNQEQRLTLPALGEGVVLVSTRLDRAERVRLANLSLGSNEGVLIGLSS
jgi:alpha-glucosidase